MRRAEQTEQLLQAKLVEEEAARRQQAELQVRFDAVLMRRRARHLPATAPQ
jgi:hypothetical protein